MQPPGADELVLIRHAAADHGGRLAGRFDPPLRPLADAAIEPLRRGLAGSVFLSSPAERCMTTAAALSGAKNVPTDPRLWEQNFGTEDGALFSDLPDLGDLPLAELAQRRAEGGESFADMVRRVHPALIEVAAAVRNGDRPAAVIAHAGTVRAGLAMALETPSDALVFEVAPLSVTRLRCYSGGVSIISVNEIVVSF